MSTQGLDAKLSAILEKVNKLDTLEAKMCTFDSKLDNLENKIDGDVKNIKIELMAIKEEVNIQKRLSEYNNRTKNVIVFGIVRKNNPDIADLFTKLCNSIEINIRKYDIKRIQIINSQSGESPVKITLISSILRNDILRNKRKLSEIPDYKNIKIKEDLPKDVREKRGSLFKYLVQHKSQGSRVLLKYDKLLIDGKLHTLEELETLGKDKCKRQRSEESSPEVLPNETNIGQTRETGKKPHKSKQKKQRGNSLERYYPKIKQNVNNSPCSSRDSSKDSVNSGQKP